MRAFIESMLFWVIVAAVAAGATLAINDVRAENYFADCPANTHFASQAQHDCTVWAAMLAHGGRHDLDRVTAEGDSAAYYETRCAARTCRHILVRLSGCQMLGHLVCYGSSRYGFDRHMVIYLRGDQGVQRWSR